ncbi:MAG: DNA2/NAM7 family helicase [Bacteroidia bacterium]|nr:DNA2/NAM7 family helicase [Bacteroidia bacterium]
MKTHPYLDTIQNLIFALNHEWEAEKDYIQRIFHTDIQKQIALNQIIYPLPSYEFEVLQAEYMLIKWEFQNQKEFPEWAKQGSPVSVRCLKTKNHEGLNGVLYKVLSNRIEVMMRLEFFEKWHEISDPSLFPLPDDKTYFTLKKELKAILQSNNRHLDNYFNILHEKKTLKINKKNTFHISEALNQSQIEALHHALNSDGLFLVHGPPGTGKTTVLTESANIFQQQGKKILITAPSNVALDVIGMRLVKKNLDFVRLGHPARATPEVWEFSMDMKKQKSIYAKEWKNIRLNIEQIHKELSVYHRNFTKEKRETKSFLKDELNALKKELKELEDFMELDVITNTQILLSTPVNLDHKHLQNFQWDICLADEAAQMPEPMFWMCARRSKNIILFGDPFQLPPVCRSEKAKKLGYETTVADKLLRIQNRHYTLLQQYRMNLPIQELVSHGMYEGKLFSDATISYQYFQRDNGEGFFKPCLWIDTAGMGFEEAIDEKTLSRFNEGEAGMVKKYLNFLWEHYEPEFLTDIGVISPYKAQISYIRNLLSEDVYRQNIISQRIQIQTVDGFQGGEKDIIIVSLVRSNPKGELGFLSDDRRLNVAFSRARKKLVIIGDSSTLQGSPYLAKALDYCMKNNFYVSAWEWLE